MGITYIYTGKTATFMPNIGRIKPGQEVHVERPIYNPYFEVKQPATTEEIQTKMKRKIKNSKK